MGAFAAAARMRTDSCTIHDTMHDVLDGRNLFGSARARRMTGSLNAREASTLVFFGLRVIGWRSKGWRRRPRPPGLEPQRESPPPSCSAGPPQTAPWGSPAHPSGPPASVRADLARARAPAPPASEGRLRREQRGRLDCRLALGKTFTFARARVRIDASALDEARRPIAPAPRLDARHKRRRERRN